jgi:hypothetical protein
MYLAGEDVSKQWTIPNEALITVLRTILAKWDDWKICLECGQTRWQVVWVGPSSDTLHGPYCYPCSVKQLRMMGSDERVPDFYAVCVHYGAQAEKRIKALARAYEKASDVRKISMPNGGDGSGQVLF